MNEKGENWTVQSLDYHDYGNLLPCNTFQWCCTGIQTETFHTNTWYQPDVNDATIIRYGMLWKCNKIKYNKVVIKGNMEANYLLEKKEILCWTM